VCPIREVQWSKIESHLPTNQRGPERKDTMNLDRCSNLFGRIAFRYHRLPPYHRLSVPPPWYRAFNGPGPALTEGLASLLEARKVAWIDHRVRVRSDRPRRV
jgi:hypothetical protein